MGKGSSGASKGAARGGGGGGGSMQQQTQPVQPKAPNPITQQPPTQQNTPVQANALNAISQMNDSQLAALMNQAKTVDLPNQLNDVSDITQKFVFAAGLNEKPAVLSDSEFKQFMKDNNMTRSDILSRSVNAPKPFKNASGTLITMSAQDVTDMMMYSRLNYIGGKQGGQWLGAGTYFDHVNGRATGYGGHTVNAVLNPKTAKVIDHNTLGTRARAFDRSHPQFARATGGYNGSYSGGKNNMAIYALALGYNAISEYGGYINVIDRAALVYNGG